MSPPRATALVIDDEPNIRATLRLCLEGIGLRVLEAPNSALSIEALLREPVDVALLDLRLGAEGGMELLPRLLADRPGRDVLVITAYATYETAVAAGRQGPRHYPPQPVPPAPIPPGGQRPLQ